MFEINSLIKKIETNKGNFIYDSVMNVLSPESDFAETHSISQFNIKYYLTKEELSWKIRHAQSMLTISLTERCNLRCEYCGYHNKYANKEYKYCDISIEQALAAVEMFLDSTKAIETPSISFYGGEPLLKFDIIQNVVEFCKKIFPFKKIEFSLTTNGVLLAYPNILEFLVAHNFFVTISLDGPKHIHDRYRIDIFGNPTFEKIEENLRLLQKSHPSYYENNISINTVMAPPVDLISISEFFKAKKLDKVNYINLMETEYFKTNYVKSEQVNANPTLLNALMKSAYMGTLKKYCNLVPNINLDTYVFPGGMCIPGVRRNFIHSDGRIILCEKVSEQDDQYNLGTVTHGVDVEKIWKLIKKTEKIAISRCSSCWAIRFCNRCFLDFFDEDANKCKIAKDVVYRDIKYYIENIMFDVEEKRKLENMVSY